MQKNKNSILLITNPNCLSSPRNNARNFVCHRLVSILLAILQSIKRRRQQHKYTQCLYITYRILSPHHALSNHSVSKMAAIRTREEQTIGGPGESGDNDNDHDHGDPSAPETERCCISWTGGKDCNLALLKCWRDPSLHVTDLVVFQPEGKPDFEAHPKKIMKAQADALGLTLLFLTLPSNIPYRDGYVNAIKELRDDHGITVIATGDMDLVEIENCSDNYIKECCAMAGGGIRTYLPLWKADREECLTTLVLEEGYEIVFSCVKSPWFDVSWCGRTLDAETFQTMITMSEGVAFEEGEMIDWGAKDPRRKPLDLGGENGEYHSMVLDGPLYKHGILIAGAVASDDVEGRKPIIQLKSVVSGPAKNGEDRWWTYDGQTRWSLGKFDVRTKRRTLEQQ
jgi:diphthine-ammonia ligase